MSFLYFLSLHKKTVIKCVIKQTFNRRLTSTDVPSMLFGDSTLFAIYYYYSTISRSRSLHTARLCEIIEHLNYLTSSSAIAERLRCRVG